jgi:hypothetical protein
LPKKFRDRAKLVLMQPSKPDFASATNASLLAEYFPAERIFSLPWLGKSVDAAAALKNPRVRKVLQKLV